MKIGGLFLAAAILLTSVSARANCIEGDCHGGAGKALFANGDAYAGQWSGGLMHGRGVYQFRSKARYEGEFYHGAMQGKGTMRYPDGAIYTGEWQANQKSGLGRMQTPSGKTQEGRWAQGRYAGPAKASTGSGTVIAEHRPNKPTNAATTAPIASKPSRSSTASSSSSNATSGLRNCNEVFCDEGQGRYEYRDGAVYIGEFEDGAPSGEGRVQYVNGDRYVGDWFENAPDGEGTYTFASGRSVLGKWDEGKLVARMYRDQPQSALAQQQSAPARRPSSGANPAGASASRPSSSTSSTASRPTTRPSTPAASSTRPTSGRAADGRARMYAVVVGIGAYTAMKTLNYTDDDAYQMFAFLKSPEGGGLGDDQIEILVDERATAANIERALAEKLGRADADDIVVFYYSGHGVDGYFIPVDFDGVNNLLSHKRVEQLLSGSAARHKLVVADACHSGSLLAARSSTSRSSERLYEAFAKSQGGTALLLSSRTEEVSLEASGLRSGVFSHYLMRGMKGEADADADRIVTVTELFQFLYGRVRDYTGKRQTPVLSGTFDRSMPVSSLR